MPAPEEKSTHRYLLGLLRATLRKLEADLDPKTPRKDELKRILRERIAAIEETDQIALRAKH